MNRITPEMALEAYEVTGLTPVQESWVDVDSKNRKCGCALSAVYCARVGEGFDKLFYRSGRADQIVCEGLGLAATYARGFVWGFGGSTVHLQGSREGYDDGRAAWEAVKHLAGDGE